MAEYSNNMLILYFSILILNLAFCFSLIKFDLRTYSPAAILWFVIVSSFLIPSITDPFTGRVAAHPLSVVYDLDILTLIEAQLYVLLILTIFFIIYLMREITNKFSANLYSAHYTEQLLNARSSGLFFYVLFLMLAFFGFYEAYSKYGNGMFSNFSFTERREGLSAISGFLLSYNLLVSAGVLFWLVLNKRFFSSFIFLTVYFLIYFVMGGSRQPLIVLFLPFVFYFFYSRRFGFFIYLFFPYPSA